jgi:hypothetical protein
MIDILKDKIYKEGRDKTLTLFTTDNTPPQKTNTKTSVTTIPVAAQIQNTRNTYTKHVENALQKVLKDATKLTKLQKYKGTKTHKFLSLFNKATNKVNQKFWEDSNAFDAKRSFLQKIQSEMAKTDEYLYNNKEQTQMMLEAYKVANNKGLLTQEEQTQYNGYINKMTPPSPDRSQYLNTSKDNQWRRMK